MIICQTGRANRDPAALLGMTSTWRPVKNMGHFDSPRYVALAKEAGSTLDVQRRKRIYRQVSELLMDENFIIAVASAPTLFAYNSRVKNVQYSVEGVLSLEHAYLE